MIVIMYIVIILAAIIVAFGIELIIAALYPGVSVPKQHLGKIPGLVREKNINRLKTRKDVNFDVDGTTVSGWLFLPEGLSSPAPCIVMGHGLGGTKNMLDSYATRFQEAGIAVLTFDYRYTGESGGNPRSLSE